MCKFFISIYLLFATVKGVSQEQEKDSLPSVVQDSIVYKQLYGIRLGIDISKPIFAEFNDNYTGLELVADYRIFKEWYLAAELGYEKETSSEDFTNSTAKGNYLRIGVNHNSFKNWLDMNNEIFTGFRYGVALFEQTLNSYTPNLTDAENGVYFPVNEVINSETTTGLNAHWGEFVVGFKVEVFNNLFASVSGSYKIMISIKDPENFKSLYAPGFNRVYDSNTGFGFNYTLSYLIPFKKK